jgi:uncharacterized iron-regulated protein
MASFFLYSTAQNKQSYKIFNNNGKKASYKDIINSSQKSDVLLFGEFHDNSVVHWLELEILKDLSDKRKLVIGAEMLESDNQNQVNQYLKGEITQKKLDSTARLWPNYKTDYKPLVDYAKELKIDFIATNIPRRFASLVFKNGFEALDKLSQEEKSWVVPLPFKYDAALPGYSKMVQEMGGHGGENLPKAQASKDATMAYFIAKNPTNAWFCQKDSILLKPAALHIFSNSSRVFGLAIDRKVFSLSIISSVVKLFLL